MSIWLLANTVGQECAQIVATDTSDAATSSQDKVGVIKGGQRHLKWTSDHATAARRVAYVDKTSNLTADFCVVTDAVAHNGKNLKIIEFTTYPGTETNLFNATLAGTDFIGSGAQDFVYKFPTQQTSKQGFAVEFGSTDYQKTARQVYFSQGLEFPDMPGNYEIELQRVSIHEPPAEHYGQRYKLWALATLAASEVTKAQLQTYIQLWKEDPVFFYDTSGTAQIGNAIEEKLWHCIILQEQITPVHDDSHRIDWTLGLLRSW